MIIFLTISAVCFLIFGVVVGGRLRAIRLGAAFPIDPVTISEVVAPVLRKYFGRVIIWLKNLSHEISLHLLVFGREVILFFKHTSIQLEKKFSRTIDLVHGKGQISRKSTTSFFLTEIKNHRDQIRGTMTSE